MLELTFIISASRHAFLTLGKDWRRVEEKFAGDLALKIIIAKHLTDPSLTDCNFKDLVISRRRRNTCAEVLIMKDYSHTDMATRCVQSSLKS